LFRVITPPNQKLLPMFAVPAEAGSGFDRPGGADAERAGRAVHLDVAPSAGRTFEQDVSVQRVARGEADRRGAVRQVRGSESGGSGDDRVGVIAAEKQVAGDAGVIESAVVSPCQC
jgi:hypothetical protein